MAFKIKYAADGLQRWLSLLQTRCSLFDQWSCRDDFTWSPVQERWTFELDCFTKYAEKDAKHTIWGDGAYTEILVACSGQWAETLAIISDKSCQPVVSCLHLSWTSCALFLPAPPACSHIQWDSSQYSWCLMEGRLVLLLQQTQLMICTELTMPSDLLCVAFDNVQLMLEFLQPP